MMPTSGGLAGRLTRRLILWVVMGCSVGIGLWVVPGEARAAATVSVALNPKSIVATGASTTTVTATLTDGAGQPLLGQTVIFSSSDSGETISRVTGHGNGTYTARVTSSTTVGSVKITATDTTSTPHASGSATLTQTAGPPKLVTVALSPPAIAANGSSTSLATATVTDASGHRLTGQKVSFSSSDRGEHIGSVVSHGD